MDYLVAFAPDHAEPEISDKDTSDDDDMAAIPSDSNTSVSKDHGS